MAIILAGRIMFIRSLWSSLAPCPDTCMSLNILNLLMSKFCFHRFPVADVFLSRDYCAWEYHYIFSLELEIIMEYHACKNRFRLSLMSCDHKHIICGLLQFFRNFCTCCLYFMTLPCLENSTMPQRSPAVITCQGSFPRNTTLPLQLPGDSIMLFILARWSRMSIQWSPSRRYMCLSWLRAIILCHRLWRSSLQAYEHIWIQDQCTHILQFLHPSDIALEPSVGWLSSLKSFA